MNENENKSRKVDNIEAVLNEALTQEVIDDLSD